MILIFRETDGVTGNRLTLGESAIDDGQVLYRNGRHVMGASGVPSSLYHNILSVAHSDSTTDAVIAGDVILGNNTPKWSRLGVSIPAANVRNVLGVDNGETIPSWKTTLDNTNPSIIGIGDVAAPGTSLIYAHRDHQHESPGTWTATEHNLLSVEHHGDTIPDTVIRGDIITGQGVSPFWTRLAMGAEGTYLRAGADDVTWSALQSGDLPNLGTAGTIPKFAATGLADSIMSESAGEITLNGNLILNEYIKRVGAPDDYVRFENDKISIGAGGSVAMVFEDDQVYSGLKKFGFGKTSLEAWKADYSTVQIGGLSSIVAFGSEVDGGWMRFSNNAYIDASDNFKRMFNEEATVYKQQNGIHSWFSDTADTADIVFTPTERMILASSDLSTSQSTLAVGKSTIENWQSTIDAFQLGGTLSIFTEHAESSGTIACFAQNLYTDGSNKRMFTGMTGHIKITDGTIVLSTDISGTADVGFTPTTIASFQNTGINFLNIPSILHSYSYAGETTIQICNDNAAGSVVLDLNVTGGANTAQFRCDDVNDMTELAWAGFGDLRLRKRGITSYLKLDHYASPANHYRFDTNDTTDDIAIYGNGNLITWFDTTNLRQGWGTSTPSEMAHIVGGNLRVEGIIRCDSSWYIRARDLRADDAGGLYLREDSATYGIFIPDGTADIELVGKNLDTNDNNVSAGVASIPDDNAISITPGKEQGVVIVNCRATGANAVYGYDVSTGSQNCTLGYGSTGTTFESAVGVLNGTTGNDGSLTVSASDADGKIYIENRTGST